MQDGYSGAFYLSLLGGLVVTAPIITYFYWEHRKTHMREKKEAILKEIHARVRTS
jgi:nicotinamide riboside transporter PnuC